MAKILVKSDLAVMYDGNLLYKRDTPYTVEDTFENKIKADKDVANGRVEITEVFTGTQVTSGITKVDLVEGDSVKIGGSLVEPITLQGAVVTAGNGNVYTATKTNMLLTISIRGTSTSRTINFELSGPSGVFQAVKCFNTLDPTIAPVSSTSGGSDTTPESWQVSVPVGYSFRARVSAVSGGTVIIDGNGVA